MFYFVQSVLAYPSITPNGALQFKRAANAASMRFSTLQRR